MVRTIWSRYVRPILLTRIAATSLVPRKYFHTVDFGSGWEEHLQLSVSYQINVMQSLVYYKSCFYQIFHLFVEIDTIALHLNCLFSTSAEHRMQAMVGLCNQ